MDVSERLTNYYDFSSDVLEEIERAAQLQNGMSLREVMSHYQIDDAIRTVVVSGSRKPLDVLTLNPKSDYDATQARVYNGGIGSGLDANAVLHAVRLFEADAHEPLIVFGNLSSSVRRAGSMALRNALQVAHSGAFEPAIHDQASYLAGSGISSVRLLGYSIGTDKALALARYGREVGITTQQIVAAEPPSTKRRNVFSLAKAFLQSGTEQKTYVRQSDSSPYQEFWDADTPLKTANYLAGLLRLSNIALARAAANGGFEDRLVSALTASPESRATVAWGTSSELVQAEFLHDEIANVRSRGYNVSSMELRGMHHAGVDDIDLHAGIFLQGLKEAA